MTYLIIVVAAGDDNANKIYNIINQTINEAIVRHIIDENIKITSALYKIYNRTQQDTSKSQDLNTIREELEEEGKSTQVIIEIPQYSFILVRSNRVFGKHLFLRILVHHKTLPSCEACVSMEVKYIIIFIETMSFVVRHYR